MDPLKSVIMPMLAIIAIVVSAGNMLTSKDGEMSSRIDVLDAIMKVHFGLDGHAGMLAKERNNADLIQKHTFQLEQMRKELDALRRACPSAAKAMTPTEYGDLMIDMPKFTNTKGQ